MKKMVLLCLCICMFVNVFAQQSPVSETPLPEKLAYLQKSKNLWKVAIIVVSAGGAMAIGGLIINERQKPGEYHKHPDMGGRLIVAGCAVMMSSMIFSIPAGVNKRKAREISFKNEQALQIQQSLVFYRSIPSISLKISL